MVSICSADGRYEVSFKPNVVIYDDGKVLWIPPAIYMSSCKIKVEYFPFDEQTCEMKLGSWTFNDVQVKLKYYEDQEKVDLEDYSPSGSWDLMACPGKLDTLQKDDWHNRSIIEYKLTMRRKTLFYTINLIIPCVLITFLSVCVFLLPSDGVQKLTLCISILLSLVVFLVLVSKILPPTSNHVPLISKYLLFAFVINIFSIIITVVIINWNFRSPRTHRMPKWIRVIFINYLPRVILLKRPRHEYRVDNKAYTLRHHQASSGRRKPSSQFGAQAERLVMSNGVRNNVSKDSSFVDNGLRLRDISSPSGGKFCSPAQSTMYDMNPDGEMQQIEDFDIPLTAETHKAMEAIRFVAAHLRNEDDFSEVCNFFYFV